MQKSLVKKNILPVFPAADGRSDILVVVVVPGVHVKPKMSISEIHSYTSIVRNNPA